MLKVFNMFLTSLLIISVTISKSWADVRKPTQCMFLLDGSLSYKHLDKAKETAKNIIMNDNSCVKIYVRWISDDSYTDKNIITSEVLNDANRINNPFGIDAKRKKATLLKENKEIKKNIINAISIARSPNSHLTDIYGALMASSARFLREPGLKPVLYIFSDLEDDAKKKDKYTIDLQNASILVMDFQSNDQSETLKRKWIDFFKKAGATSVDIRHLDEPLTRYTRR